MVMVFGMEYKTLELSKISLDLENPRHEPFQNETEVIVHLCEKEKIVLPLAEDIAKNGLNPMDLSAVIKRDDGSFFCAEGNRRICALKLLTNPKLAPPNFQDAFIKAAEDWRPIKNLNVVEFKDRDEAQPWISRIHAGPDSGRGRLPWNSEQKTRWSLKQKGQNNILDERQFALAVLDYAEEHGYILKKDRDGRLSTVKNQLSNRLLRKVIGLEERNVDSLKNLSGVNLIAFKRFIADVAKRDIDSWRKKKETEIYANNLINSKGVTGKIESNTGTISAGGAVIKSPPKPPPPPKPTEPLKPEVIPLNTELLAALKEIPSYKLENIYFSLCKVSLKEHTPLLYVGSWMFIETLTALCGRHYNTDFHSYLSVQKMTSLSLGAKNETKAISEAVKRISEAGNTTKHNKTSAAFNGEQLANDFEVMKSLLVALAKEAKGKTK